MGNNYKDLVEEYKQINQNIRNQLIAISLTVIAAIFVLVDKEIGIKFIKLYLWSFIFFVMTIGFNILAAICKSKHYEFWLDGKIKDIDYSNTIWGKIAEFLFWLPLLTFVIGIVTFVTIIILIAT